jgi:hypothetical protein
VRATADHVVAAVGRRVAFEVAVRVDDDPVTCGAVRDAAVGVREDAGDLILEGRVDAR